MHIKNEVMDAELINGFWLVRGNRCWKVYRDGGDRQFGALQATVLRKPEALAVCSLLQARPYLLGA